LGSEGVVGRNFFLNSIVQALVVLVVVVVVVLFVIIVVVVSAPPLAPFGFLFILVS
jgi:hypothetical protein